MLDVSIVDDERKSAIIIFTPKLNSNATHTHTHTHTDMIIH
jgi:hypothetical protein